MDLSLAPVSLQLRINGLMALLIQTRVRLGWAANVRRVMANASKAANARLEVSNELAFPSC